MTKIRQTTKQMSILKCDEVRILDSQSETENHILQFYFELYSTENSSVDNGIVENAILSLVSFEDNIMLTNIPTKEEVRAAVFVMNGSGSPSPDGFGGGFINSFGT